MLSDAESGAVFERVILPAALAGAVPQERPVVVLVAGAPGAGKSTAADLVMAVLARRGGAVRVCSDLYKDAHPRYRQYLAADPRTAGARVRCDTRRWRAAVEEQALRLRLDVVVETVLDGLDEAGAYRAAGYRTELLVVVAPAAESALGRLERYTAALRTCPGDGGRFVSWENADRAGRSLPQAVARIEAEQLVDRIAVVRRDLVPVYANELSAGHWLRPARAGQAVTDELVRPWSDRETATFRRCLARAERELHHEQIGQAHRLVALRDAERAAALAEPVRRIAQPTLQPPGVDYHRLSQEEHHWIWENLVLEDLGEITPHQQPICVVVMGPPGAGKSRASRMVMRALRERRPTLVCGDDYKAYHPDYLRLLREQPRTASERIRADYKAWQARAEAHVQAQRGDAVLEVAPGSARDVLASASAWRRSGYRVELVVLDVREADSRQGTALRYAQASRSGVPTARYTTAAGHDRCAAAVLDAVRATEAQAAVDQVTVVRRDGTAVYRNDLDADGRWAQPARAALVLAAGRVRPYDEQEALRFLNLQRELRAALPQYRDDVDAITRLAWPLLPARLQPHRLGQPTVLALPARRTPSYGPSSSLSLAS
ncbi:zeta toxin family protein [Kitasatospora sp. NPDC051984]|uniref:zeta toxin family protein n=1 Tax=Kitasatospora sp. NPDC051984 TaxID=3364059 RepID=UPI0037C9429A